MADGALATTAADSSANATPGAYQGTVQASATTPIACPKDAGTAWVLDGLTNYVDSPTVVPSPGPQTFTVAVWFKTATAAGKLIGFGSSATGASTAYDRHLYITSTGALAFGTYSGGAQVLQTTTTVTDNVWHQAVGTFSTTAGMCLYLDGAQVTCNTSYRAAEAHAGYWRVGYDTLTGWPNAPVSAFFRGSLRFAAAYRTALSPGEVQWQYAIGKPV